VAWSGSLGGMAIDPKACAFEWEAGKSLYVADSSSIRFRLDKKRRGQYLAFDRIIPGL
jgi:hypothetical protein